MTVRDRTLVDLFLQAQAVEREMRSALAAGCGRDEAQARDVLRHATATRKSLEGWIANRSIEGGATTQVRPDAATRSV